MVRILPYEGLRNWAPGDDLNLLGLQAGEVPYCLEEPFLLEEEHNLCQDGFINFIRWQVQVLS